MFWTEKERKEFWKSEQVRFAEVAHNYPCCEVPTIKMCWECYARVYSFCKNKADIVAAFEEISIMQQERPIIFNTAMVQAILDGRKTQTRRVMKYQCVKPWFNGVDWSELGNDDTVHFKFKCPYGQPGDLLYIRERWATSRLFDLMAPKEIADIPGADIFYYQKDKDNRRTRTLWRPSIHLPKKLSRIWLKIKDIRVERVNGISDADSIKEGALISSGPSEKSNWGEGFAIACFRKLWDSINGKPRKDGVDISWAANPWVWVVEFEVK